MANHAKYNKIVKKLDDRTIIGKTFYDSRGYKVIGLKTNEVYLKSEVDYILKLLKEEFGELIDINYVMEKKINEIELENYKLKKSLGKVKVIEEVSEYEVWYFLYRII